MPARAFSPWISVPLVAFPLVTLIALGIMNLPGRAILLLVATSFFVAVLMRIVLGEALSAAFPRPARRPTVSRVPKTCAICGYDLRATPDRCPECGTDIPHPPLEETPALQRADERAEEIARERRADYLGTEHVLLGILREGDNVAAAVLDSCGIDEAEVLARLSAMLPEEGSQPPGMPRQDANLKPFEPRKTVVFNKSI